jgi:hypothetical protein
MSDKGGTVRLRTLGVRDRGYDMKSFITPLTRSPETRHRSLFPMCSFAWHDSHASTEPVPMKGPVVTGRAARLVGPSFFPIVYPEGPDSIGGNSNTFTWSGPWGVVGFTGQRRVARAIEPRPSVPLNLPALG